MKTAVAFKPRVLEYITPYLPAAAVAIAREWEQAQRSPALVMAFDHEYKLQCRNCNGVGLVYLKLTKGGPYSTPLAGKDVYTYLDNANGRFPPGWYVVKETRVFQCPACQG